MKVNATRSRHATPGARLYQQGYAQLHSQALSPSENRELRVRYIKQITNQRYCKGPFSKTLYKY